MGGTLDLATSLDIDAGLVGAKATPGSRWVYRTAHSTCPSYPVATEPAALVVRECSE